MPAWPMGLCQWGGNYKLPFAIVRKASSGTGIFILYYTRFTCTYCSEQIVGISLYVNLTHCQMPYIMLLFVRQDVCRWLTSDFTSR